MIVIILYCFIGYKDKSSPLQWGARAVWGARKTSGWGVSWTTSELSASSTSTSGRLQPRTRGNDAERQNNFPPDWGMLRRRSRRVLISL